MALFTQMLNHNHMKVFVAKRSTANFIGTLILYGEKLILTLPLQGGSLFFYGRKLMVNLSCPSTI